MPRAKPAKPTLVLYVRHGQTPTTGSTLPGRAPGLHLADAGVAQAEAAGASPTMARCASGSPKPGTGRAQ